LANPLWHFDAVSGKGDHPVTSSIGCDKTPPLSLRPKNVCAAFNCGQASFFFDSLARCFVTATFAAQRLREHFDALRQRLRDSYGASNPVGARDRRKIFRSAWVGREQNARVLTMLRRPKFL